MKKFKKFLEEMMTITGGNIATFDAPIIKKIIKRGISLKRKKK